MEYGKWLGTWLALYVKPSVKLRTYDKYEIVIRKHLAPYLGGYEMEDLTAEVLQRHVVNLSGTLSGSYINDIVSVMQKSLEMAVNLGIVRTQYADKIVRPKAISKKVDSFSVSEQKMIEYAVKMDNRPKMIGVIICLYTGLRIGELLALKWCDVDFRNNIITVCRSCHYGRDNSGCYGYIEEEPKSSSSVREIPIAKQLMPWIRELRKNIDCEYVINSDNKPVSVRSYQYSFELMLKKFDIPRKNFHALRHTFATRALECGMDVKALSEILGHKNADITLNRYAHSMLKHKKTMMNRVGRLLSRDL